MAGTTTQDSGQSRYGYVVLGSDDCETCGTNYDRLDWSVDAGTIAVRLSVGCYGSESFQSTDAGEAADFIVSLAPRFTREKARKALKAEAARLREQFDSDVA